MRVIKLCSGKGNGIDTACLMTASNMLIGRGEDGDENSCVCPVLREFIIQTNDVMPDDLRAELYGPLVFEILGTRNDDVEVLRQRALAMADWAVREIEPIALDEAGLKIMADTLRSLPEIVDRQTADATFAAVADAYATYTALAVNAVYAADPIWRLCPEIILRVAAIGDLRPKSGFDQSSCVLTVDELADVLS